MERRIFESFRSFFEGQNIGESRNYEYAEYEEKKGKVIAYLQKQKASQFTKYAKSWTELDFLIEKHAEAKRQLNEIKNEMEDKKNHIHTTLRSEIENLFDDDEKLMTLTVDCLGSTFTLNKLSEAKPDTVVTNVDYQKIYEELNAFVAGKEGLQEMFEDITQKYTEVITIAGKTPERGLRVNIKEGNNINEGLFETLIDNISKIVDKFATTFKRWFGKKEKELKAINERIDDLVELVKY
jgi:hypothetical protein